MGNAGVGSKLEDSRLTGLGVGEQTGEEAVGRSRAGLRLARLLSSVWFSWLVAIEPVFSSAKRFSFALKAVALSCAGLAGCDQLHCVGLRGDWEGLHGAERAVRTTWDLNERVGLQ